MKLFESTVPVKRITPKGEHEQYFFGYYDLPAYSGDGRLHLTNIVPQMDHLPQDHEKNQIAVINLADGSVKTVATTNAWNFQQGSMLQWYPAGSSDTIIYNDYRNGRYVAVIKNINTGDERVIDHPLASVSADGKYGLSVNFSRIYDFRPGYGYQQIEDPNYELDKPDDDGIFLIELESGQSRLLHSYRELGELFSLPEGVTKAKLVVNHITFGPDSSRFVFLLRFFSTETQKWESAIGSSDITGDPYVWRGYGMASHYYWKDAERLLIYSNAGGDHALYELVDKSQVSLPVRPDVVKEDIHCSYSPDGRYLIGDGYPDAEGFRSIYLVDLKEDHAEIIARIYGPTPAITDVRCDLHIRWAPCGTKVSFDSIHEGFRAIYELEVFARRT